MSETNEELEIYNGTPVNLLKDKGFLNMNVPYRWLFNAATLSPTALTTAVYLLWLQQTTGSPTVVLSASEYTSLRLTKTQLHSDIKLMHGIELVRISRKPLERYKITPLFDKYAAAERKTKTKSVS